MTPCLARQVSHPITAVVLALGLSLLLGAKASGAERAAVPNIVMILADDLGYGDVGCYGQKQIQTPNIDRFAAEGVRFTQCYAGSTVCAPSRCCLMTSPRPAASGPVAGSTTSRLSHTPTRQLRSRHRV